MCNFDITSDCFFSELFGGACYFADYYPNTEPILFWFQIMLKDTSFL